jgi:hypothetical protein
MNRDKLWTTATNTTNSAHNAIFIYLFSHIVPNSIIIIIIIYYINIYCFFWAQNLVSLLWTLLVYEYPLGTSETFLCFMPVHPIQIVPPAGVQLPQIQFIINWMFSEGKLSHLVRYDILLHYFKVSLLII